MADLAKIAPGRWTLIAERLREGPGFYLPPWEPLPGAPLAIEEAQQLVDAKRLVMATRFLPDRLVLLVQPATLAPREERESLGASAFNRC